VAKRDVIKRRRYHRAPRNSIGGESVTGSTAIFTPTEVWLRINLVFDTQSPKPWIIT
jgi:hypothetical protein